MAIDRESLKKMIDFIPEEKLRTLQDLLDKWVDDELTKEDIKDIKAAENRIAAGEFDRLEDLYIKYRDEL